MTAKPRLRLKRDALRVPIDLKRLARLCGPCPQIDGEPPPWRGAWSSRAAGEETRRRVGRPGSPAPHRTQSPTGFFMTSECLRP
jgi:hypothetical protein